MKRFNQDISKTIVARSFKLGQLMKANEGINWLNFKKKSYFIYSSYCPLPFANLAIEILL